MTAPADGNDPAEQARALAVWVDELRLAVAVRDDRILRLEVELEATRRQRDLARQELEQLRGGGGQAAG